MHLLRRSPRRRLALALQGGGAHGAFSWGVLDRLLERGVVVDALSGTSAGACNAVAVAHGWRRDGAPGARVALDAFWSDLAGALEGLTAAASGFAAFALGLATHLFSPYELNPAGYHPVRDLLDKRIDFEGLRRDPPFPLVVATTHVGTGTARHFDERSLSLDAVMASTALPQIHHAVEIEGQLLWDGGLTSNPPILPLIERMPGRDLLIVRISPLDATFLPRSASQIRHRFAEIAFGQPLRADLERLAEARVLARGGIGWLRPALRRRARTRVWMLDADGAVARLAPTTRLFPTRPVLHELRDAGRAAADGFLDDAATTA